MELQYEACDNQIITTLENSVLSSLDQNKQHGELQLLSCGHKVSSYHIIRIRYIYIMLRYIGNLRSG